MLKTIFIIKIEIVIVQLEQRITLIRIKTHFMLLIVKINKKKTLIRLAINYLIKTINLIKIFKI